MRLPFGAAPRRLLRVAPRQDAGATQTAQPVTLVLAASTSTLDATLLRMRWLIALAALAALGLSLLAIALIVPGALRPLRSVATAMGGSIEASVTQGRFTVTLSLPAAT